MSTILFPSFLDSLPNLALNQSVLSSSIHSAPYKSEYAVDGSHGTFFHTAFGTKHWFLIDLQVISEIFFVRILQRETPSTYILMKYITITIGNGNKHANAKCVENKSQETALMYDYYCDKGPMIGKYVTIILEDTVGTNFIIAEVEVYGNNIE